MKNRTLKLLLALCLISLSDIIAQPYIYYNSSYSDTVFGDIRQISRYDISTNFDEAFLQPEEYFDPIIDPLRSYLYVDIRNWLSFLYDCSDTSTHYELNNFLGVQVNEMLYSPQRNKLYIFSDDFAKISLFDLYSGTVISETDLGKTAYENFLMNPVRSSFFSSDNSKIYIFNVDTNNVDQVWTYSLETSQITDKRSLSELGGYSGSAGYSLTFGRNGKGIIESYPVYYGNPDQDFYYKLYDFDADTSSPFIYHDGECEAYFSGNGEFMLIFETYTDTLNDSLSYYHTGEVEIYNSGNGDLVKTLTLPPYGIVYTFDNYPNNIYYAIDIEEPTREIYVLKMDSICNVLDLTSLDPSSKIVNSPPFTLTVNGHGFDSLSTVYFNENAKTTTYVSDSVLTAEISTSDISTVGDYPVWVTDQWATSDTLIFSVVPHSPVLTSISPEAAYFYPNADMSDFTVTAYGEFFTDSSVVYFNGNAKTTTYVSDSVLTFQIHITTDIPGMGNYPVWVSNYGSDSDTLIFSKVSSLPQSVAPEVECVHDNGDHTYTAYFSYNNNNSVSVYIPLGSKNYVQTILLPDRGQPKVFLVGLHTSVFNASFPGTSSLTWFLHQAGVTASRTSTPCP